MSVEVEVNENDLAEMVEQVWMSYLDPEGINPLLQTYDENQASEVHSSVSISGSWSGHPRASKTSGIGAGRCFAQSKAISFASSSLAIP